MLRKNSLLTTILIVLLLLLLNGCGTPSQTTTSTSADTKAESKEKGYIYQSDSEVIFITWTKDNTNKIVGQLQITDLTNSGIQSSNHGFNGVIDGSNISITITGSVLNDGWTGKVFTGSLDGTSKLTLLFPATNGMMNSVAFSSGSVADFNNKVSSLNQTYAKIQSDRQAQDQKADQFSKQQSIIKSVSSADKKVKDDTTALANVTFSDALSQYDSHLKELQQHYTKLKSDANVQPFTSYQLSVVQYDLSAMQYDISAFEYSDTVMQSKNGNLQTMIKNVQDDIKNYNSIWSSYQSIGGQGSTITADDMSTSISNVQSQISKNGDTLKSAQAQADSYNKQAKDLYDTAESFVKGLKAVN